MTRAWALVSMPLRPVAHALAVLLWHPALRAGYALGAHLERIAGAWVLEPAKRAGRFAHRGAYLAHRRWQRRP